MMSTDKKKKKRVAPRIDRIKIIEYVSIGLVILLFLGLAFLYGRNKEESAPATPAPTIAVSPVPTKDTSIRGKNILDAIDGSSFSLTYQQDRYDLLSSDGVAIEMHMLSDDDGLSKLSFVTELCADPEDASTVSAALKAENKRTVSALRDLLDLIMPVLRRTVSDSDTIVKQCTEVVSSGESYSKHIGRFTVRILSDPDISPQTVTIEFIADP